MTPRAPVLLIIFNRPATTRRVLDALRRARPPKLLVAADGPRPGVPGDDRRCREARAVLDEVDWPCDIATDYGGVNLGCRQRCVKALDWAFSLTDRAIVLEDDCVPATDFVPLCDELLERYRDDERVHMIRGTNLLGGQRTTDASYYASRIYNVWGWATWARAWRHYDGAMQRWPEVKDSGWLERYLPSPAMAQLARFFFEETYAGRIDAWDYQWVLSSWLRGAHALVPAVNLVTNIGFGSDATHTGAAENRLANLPTAALNWPLRHPPDVVPDEDADRLEWEGVYPELARQDSMRDRLVLRGRGLRQRLQRLIARPRDS
jgi:hypothetical protein